MSLVRTKMILIVDDEANMRALLSDFLIAQGYTVEAFSSFEDASQAIESEPCHLNGTPSRYAAVISDFNMGEGPTGLDFLRLVKKHSPKLPVFLMTAHPTKELAAQAENAGAADFLSKPFPLPTLAKALKGVLV